MSIVKMSHNVPAVGEVLGARTGKRKGNPFSPPLAFPGRLKSGRSEPWERGRRPTDLGERSPERPKGA